MPLRVNKVNTALAISIAKLWEVSRCLFFTLQVVRKCPSLGLKARREKR